MGSRTDEKGSEWAQGGRSDAGSQSSVPCEKGLWSWLPAARRAEQGSAEVLSWAPARSGFKSAMAAWATDPMSVAVIIWSIVFIVPLIFLVLLHLGVFNSAIPNPATRNDIAEFCNIIMCALFILMCLAMQVVMTQQTYLLYRWHANDIVEVRKVFCSRGTRKPFEWAHVAFVIIWLHLMCIACYVYGILFFIDVPTKNHKAAAVSISGALSCVFFVIGAVYQALSPLNRTYPALEAASREEAAAATTAGSAPPSPLSLKVAEVEHPEWAGHVLCSFCQSPKIAALSCFCSCCLLGANVQRLQLGRCWVQGSLLMACTLGPLFVFEIAAHSVPSDLGLKRALVIAGIVCALLGFAMGGFWRAMMRRTFGLPGRRWGCGSAACSDLLLWVFCWPCALSQEVRTGDQYDVENGRFVVLE